VCDDGSDGGKVEPIRKCKECAEVDSTELVVCIHVKLKLIVDDGSDISVPFDMNRREEKMGNVLALWRLNPQYAVGMTTYMTNT
jgi:hypothetical protein